MKCLNTNRIIALGSDRRGFLYKQKLIDFLQKKGYETLDVGPYDENIPYDYPIYGEKVGKAVAKGDALFGVVICGTGIGISIAANKVKGVRCGMAYDDEVAAWMRKHNDANVVAFGQDYMRYEDVERRLEIFLNTAYLGDYHVSRIQQIADIEQEKEIKQSPVLNKDRNK